MWLALLLALAGTSVRGQDEAPPTYSVRELSHRVYELSYIDMESCKAILGMFGYSVSAPAGQVSLEQLPAVFDLPFSVPAGVVGRSALEPGQELNEAALTNETLSAPLNRLLVLYHSSQTEEVGRLMDLLEQTIDVPDRQVLIEGMVIELTEDNLKEIGVQWDLLGGEAFRITSLDDGTEVPFVLSYNPELTAAEAAADHLQTIIRAVIQEGRAEVLSCPSVLVLNNRNARIKVVRDTPILSTKVSYDVQNVDVRFEAVGIVLNIKPRISHDNSMVTMQIIAEVSEIPAGEELVVGETVVAPAIERRIVETIARVHNNTPFIIGGLIRNEQGETVDRIPVLSRIPILGVLFRRRVTTREKREVIIVLTPRVIPTMGGHRPLLPKDSERFDFLDNRLFRNTYRIKAEDVLDLGFLRSNETILTAFDRAKALVRRHPQYAGRSPFKELADSIIPGEDALVVRMIYEIAQDKLQLHENLRTENLILFQRDESKPSGFELVWLHEMLAEAGPDGTVEGYFSQPYPKDVAFLRYKLDPEGGLGAALRSPAAQVEWVTVGSRDEVDDTLLQINRLGEDCRYHEFALVLNRARDLDRLKTAIALREVAKVNDFGHLLVLRNFGVGRRFGIPELGGEGDERVFLIDHEVAEFFFKSDYYYPALKAKLEAGYRLLDQALEREGMR